MARKETAAPAAADLSTAQLDRERRFKAASGAVEDTAASEARDFTGDGNDTSAYFGVSPEYMNYANKTDKPYRAPEGSAERWDEDQQREFEKSPEVVEMAEVVKVAEAPPAALNGDSAF